MKHHYIYPAVIEVTPTGYSAYYPDFPGNATAGTTIQETVSMLKELLAVAIYDVEQSGKPLPSPSNPPDIQLEDPSDMIIYIDSWVLPVHDELENKTVTKNCTLPKWLRDAGEEAKLNFSQLLQSAIKESLGISKD